MTMTTPYSRVPACATATPSPFAMHRFRGAAPLAAGVQGTGVSSVRTLAVIGQVNTDTNKIPGPAARGRPL